MPTVQCGMESVGWSSMGEFNVGLMTFLAVITPPPWVHLTTLPPWRSLRRLRRSRDGILSNLGGVVPSVAGRSSWDMNSLISTSISGFRIPQYSVICAILRSSSPGCVSWLSHPQTWYKCCMITWVIIQVSHCCPESVSEKCGELLYCRWPIRPTPSCSKPVSNADPSSSSTSSILDPSSYNVDGEGWCFFRVARVWVAIPGVFFQWHRDPWVFANRSFTWRVSVCFQVRLGAVGRGPKIGVWVAVNFAL